MNRLRPIYAAVVATLLTGCGGTATAMGPQSASPRQNSNPSIQLRMDSDRAVMDTPSSMCNVSLAIDAVAGSLGKSHWNTTDGNRPANSTALDVETKGLRIYTPVQFKNMQVLSDHRTHVTGEFAALGGSVGPDQIVNPEFPVPKIGVRYVLLLVPSTTPGQRGYTESTLIIYDAFPIDSYGSVLLKPQLIEQGQVSQQEKRIALTDLEQQLKECS